MSVTTLNICLLIGWLMATGGLCVLNLGAGIAAGGFLLICLTLLMARMGGVFTPKGDA